MFFIRAEDAAAQTIAAVIGNAHRVFVILRPDNRGDGSEDFIVIGWHARLDLGQYGCGIIGTCAVGHFATAKHLGALLNTLFHLIADGFELLLARQRPEFGVFVHRIAHRDRLHRIDIGTHESVVILLGHDETLGRDAGLAVVIKPSHGREFHRRFDIGVVEHEIGVVRAQFEHGLLQMFRSLGPDMAARAVRAGHGHAAHQLMADQLVGGIVVNDDNVEQVFGQARFFADLFQTQAAAGADFRVFQDAAVAGHQVRGQHAHGLVEGEVPRLDLIDHADGLIGHHTALLAARVFALFVLQHVGAVLGGIFKDLRAEFDLGQPVFVELADLAGHQFRQAFLILAQLLGDLF